MSSETERLAEVITDLGERLSQAFGDVISPEASRHLRNAQREALTALFLIYEEQLGRRTGRGAAAADAGRDWPADMDEAVGEGFDPDLDDEAPPPRQRRAPRPPGGRPSPRVKRIDLD